jgi:ubiquinone/menaquinone biosynthesis C-methylase UbiE
MDILRIRRPAESTGLPSAIADQVYIYNLLQHVISPIHVLDECTRLLKSGGKVFLLEQLNLPTDSEHPHTLRIEMFDQWVERDHYYVEKRKLVQDSILSSIAPSRPGSGYCVLYLMATKP